MTTNEDQHVDNVSELLSQLEEVRIAEKSCKQEREKIEAELANAVDAPEGGQTTVEVDGKKITVERPLSYRADLDQIQEFFNNGTHSDVAHCVPIKEKRNRELDKKGYEWIRQNMPGIFEKIAPYVEVKPRPPKVTIKVA